MIKFISFLSVAVAWFVLAGIYIAGNASVEDWILSLFMYLVGLQWVYAYCLNKTMYTLYIAEPLIPNDGKFKSLRNVHFIIGLFICIMSSIY
jgi:hypothetical protein